MKPIKIKENIYEIPRTGNMLVPGRIYASEKLLRQAEKDESLQQVKNVATLPGIVKFSLAMPDIHEGYGFPIGGVAAVDLKNGYISPGGVGYDINCGVRLLRTNLFLNDIKEKIDTLAAAIFNNVPSGVGSKHGIKSVNDKEFKKVVANGAKWAVNNGFGVEGDIEVTEENGCMENQGFEFLSQRAVERGKHQLGTLGAGNHFVEIQVVEEIFCRETADILNIEEGMIVVMFHTGSRGFGYQICDDFLKKIRKQLFKYSYAPPDAQLVACPFKSDLGEEYFHAMNSAANFAWANRQIIKELIERAFISSLAISPKSLNMTQIYDISHNIAKIENNLLIHRKGAVGALPPMSDKLPEHLTKIGQPVIIPGDMGTGSYLLTAKEKIKDETFSSVCHGAGRSLSRRKSLKKFGVKEILENMERKGISILAKSKRTIVEESPESYKDIHEVINVVETFGLTEKVALLKPVAVIKG